MRLPVSSLFIGIVQFTSLLVLSTAPVQAQISAVTLVDTTHISITDSAPAVGTTVTLYSLSSPYTCSAAAAPPTPLPLDAAGPITLSAGKLTMILKSPLTSGSVICARDSSANPSAAYIYIPPRQPVFSKPPTDGSTTLQVQATPSDGTSSLWTTSVQLLQLDTQDETCDTSHGSNLTLAGASAATSQNADKSGAVTFSVATPLVAGSYLCALESVSVSNSTLKPLPLDPATPNGSMAKAVTSATDWGLVRAYFTGGVVLANDNSNFSSAYEFLDLTVDKTWLLPSCSFCQVTGTNVSHTAIKVLDNATVYTVSGKAIKIRGATLSDTSLTATSASIGLRITGRALSIVNGAHTQHIHGAITITGGSITYAAQQITVKPDAIYLPSDGSLQVTGGPTITFSGSDLSNSIGHSVGMGINTFFDARLTAIPVASNPANTTSAAAKVSGSGLFTPADSSTSTGSTSNSSFNTSQKTARIAVGAYFPVLLTHWTWNSNTNALFIAPEAKIGFDTITQASQQNVVLADGTTGTETYAQVYKFWTYGARIGHMQLAKDANQAPEIYSYLDFGVGPYSNLESLVCKRTEYTAALTATPPGTPLPGQYPATNYASSDCTAAYPAYYVAPTGATFVYLPYETRKRTYRIDLEGLLKIPATAFYVGFNANIGQRSAGGHFLDPAFKAPDDLRFFFGTKFDISKVLSKLGINLNQ